MVSSGASELLQPLLHHDDQWLAVRAATALCHIAIHEETAHALGHRTLEGMTDLLRALNPLGFTQSSIIDSQDVATIVELFHPDRHVAVRMMAAFKTAYYAAVEPANRIVLLTNPDILDNLRKSARVRECVAPTWNMCPFSLSCSSLPVRVLPTLGWGPLSVRALGHCASVAQALRADVSERRETHHCLIVRIHCVRVPH